jgi:DNA polymerase-3 subunit beta
MGPTLKNATETATADTAPTYNDSGLSFRADQKTFGKVAALLARVADRRSSMPILGHACMRIDSDGATLAVTDLNLTAIVRVPAWTGSRGGFCVPAKSLADLVKKLPAGELNVRRANLHTLQIASGNLSTLLQGIPDRDFPKIPDDQDLPWVTCDAATFADMFERVAYAVCKDETRFHLNGIKLEMDSAHVRMVATDGHRLVRLDRDTRAPYQHGCILPSKAAGEIARLLAPSKRGKATIKECQIAFRGPHMFVRYHDTTIIAKLIDAQFPPYDQVIPKESSKFYTVNREAMIGALGRAKTIAGDTRGVRLDFTTDSTLCLVCDHPDLGEHRETVDYSGIVRDFKIGVNPRYLTEALESLDSEEITICLGSELDPILVADPRNGGNRTNGPIYTSDHVMVIMPMRI